ncbi:hypothetical protein FH972_008058 [Carpinus fangiana]|uniref:Uncharacterized protein n=1 Tax=Carpinus fangiana TaxID=176857 RepID=A0A5N6QZT8_9ROSI|nr:hypothetical protein FH972_008058 [Carpinus fangiana]
MVFVGGRDCGKRCSPLKPICGVYPILLVEVISLSDEKLPMIRLEPQQNLSTRRMELPVIKVKLSL